MLASRAGPQPQKVSDAWWLDATTTTGHVKLAGPKYAFLNFQASV